MSKNTQITLKLINIMSSLLPLHYWYSSWIPFGLFSIMIWNDMTYSIVEMRCVMHVYYLEFVMVRNFAWWVILLMNWGSCVESGCNVDCVQRMFKNSLNTSLIVGKILNYPYLLNSGDNLLIFIILWVYLPINWLICNFFFINSIRTS